MRGDDESSGDGPGPLSLEASASGGVEDDVRAAGLADARVPCRSRRREPGGVAVLAAALVFWRGTARSGPVLPSTPMAWLDAFSAGVARDSGAVCSRLLSTEFRASMQRDAHESCSAYYRGAQVLSVRVLRILRLGETAAIEIRYFPRGGYSTFVLDHLASGWQAVAIVPGGPLPIA